MSKCRRKGGYNGMGPIIRHIPVHVPDRHFQFPPSTEQESGQNVPHDHSSLQQPHFSDHEMETNNHEEEANNHETEINNHEIENSISDETGNSAKRDKVLHPTSFWFHDSEVVNAVVNTSYKMYFLGPWCNWSMVPREAKVLWWNAFKKKFSWDPLVAKDVKKGWERKCKRRLSSIISAMCTSTKYDAKWCAASIKTQIMQLREEEEFKKKSKQCSLNKKNPEKEMPLHCQGSKPTERLRIDLEKDLKCKITPSKSSCEQGRKADFENKKAANFESEDKRSEDELLEALGGWKQGRIYSLGLAATIFFDKSQKDNNAKKARIDHVNQLESHVEQLNSENVQLRKELDAANEKLDATT